MNEAIVAGTGLEGACHIGSNANAFASIITQLYHQPFTKEEIILRKRLLGTTYDNEKKYAYAYSMVMVNKHAGYAEQTVFPNKFC